MKLSLSLFVLAITGAQVYPYLKERADAIAAEKRIVVPALFEFPDNFGGEWFSSTSSCFFFWLEVYSFIFSLPSHDLDSPSFAEAHPF